MRKATEALAGPGMLHDSFAALVGLSSGHRVAQLWTEQAWRRPRREAKPKPMPKKQLQHFEKRLLEERRRVLKELGHHDELFNRAIRPRTGT